MTKASGIVKFVMVRAFCGQFLPTLHSITKLAHPFGVVLLVHMRTLSNVHTASCPYFLSLDGDTFLLSRLMAFLLLLSYHLVGNLGVFHLLNQSSFFHEIPMNYVPIAFKMKEGPIFLVIVILICPDPVLRLSQILKRSPKYKILMLFCLHL